MFRVKTLSALSVFQELFIENRNVHDYLTRQQDKFHVPNAMRNYMQRTMGSNCMESYHIEAYYLWLLIVII